MAVFNVHGNMNRPTPRTKPIIKAIQSSPETYISYTYEYLAKYDGERWSIYQRLADGHPWKLYALCYKDGDSIECEVYPRDRKGEADE